MPYSCQTTPGGGPQGHAEDGAVRGAKCHWELRALPWPTGTEHDGSGWFFVTMFPLVCRSSAGVSRVPRLQGVSERAPPRLGRRPCRGPPICPRLCCGSEGAQALRHCCFPPHAATQRMPVASRVSTTELEIPGSCRAANTPSSSRVPLIGPPVLAFNRRGRAAPSQPSQARRWWCRRRFPATTCL